MPDNFNRIVQYATSATDDVNQIIKAWEGDSGCGVPLRLTQVDKAGTYALDVRNKHIGGYCARFTDSAGVNMLTISQTGIAIGTGKNVTLPALTYISTVPKLAARQGDGSADWGNAGTTDTTVTGNIIMYTGVLTMTITGSDLVKSATVIFPAAFTGKPVLYASMMCAHREVMSVGIIHALSYETSRATILARRTTLPGSPPAPGDDSFTVSWMAVGL